MNFSQKLWGRIIRMTHFSNSKVGKLCRLHIHAQFHFSKKLLALAVLFSRSFYEMLTWNVDSKHIWKLNAQFCPKPITSDQIRSVAQSCPNLCDPMNSSTPGLPVHHQLPELTQTHIHRVSDAIQSSHPLSSPSPPAPNPSQHQSLFQWVNSLHEVAKVLEFQL